ncbi:MAG: prepilin-type N-terminal cleavage/methylation domain-containing protein [Oscillibacter sp.]|nr:prepilin-type N-terminal cleavage/methylation domain-containing protein [Oscillibacter sp.]
MKKMNKKGFTLAELLIVVAIIAVLVAIAIPVFTKRLESSRESTDAANLRSAYAAAQVAALAGELDDSQKYFFIPDSDTGLVSGGSSDASKAPQLGKGTPTVGDSKVGDSLPSVCVYSGGTDAQNKKIRITTSGGAIYEIAFNNSAT